MGTLADEFKAFILRGNVIDLAVAVVIGAAFTDVVTAVVENLIMPLIALIGGQPDFSSIAFTINDTTFSMGNILNAVIGFLIIAAVIFFLVVKPMNLLIERARRRETTPDPTTAKCAFCMGEIPLGATRCMHCTSENPLGAAPA